MRQDIWVAIGANLASPRGLSPIETAREAVVELDSLPVLDLFGLSCWYESAPIPASDQPSYINAVAHLRGEIDPVDFLGILQEIERVAGRRRGVINAARPLDLDIIAVGDLVRIQPDLILPHPRAHLRAFVLMPLADVAPNWVHPVSFRNLDDLIADLPAQTIRRL